MYLWLGVMKNKTFSDNSYAASEVIGAIILVLIAVGAFGAIYYQVFPVPLPSPDSHIKLAWDILLTMETLYFNTLVVSNSYLL